VVLARPCLLDPSQRRWFYPVEIPDEPDKPVKVVELGPMQ
jgi:hypothetical protein